MKSNKLLTIAIPTYNRAKFLKIGLEKLLLQIEGNENLIDLLVSDNCSEDDTKKIVENFIHQGYPIRYNRNLENLGMDGNFAYCFNNAKGKYIWILGDDDYLVDGTIDQIISIIGKDDYGLIHLNTSEFRKENKVYDSAQDFLNKVNINITFISGNIVNREAVQKVSFDNYEGTLLSQLPVYLNAITSFEKNVIVYQQLLDAAVDSVTNGGYNIFEIFVTNYLTILKEFRIDLGIKWYEIQKYKLFRYFIWLWMSRLFLNKNHGLRFKTNNWLKIILKQYWYEVYIYPVFIIFYIKKVIQ